MAFTGTVKSKGKEYGFVHCDETYATYQRDVFLNKLALGEQSYEALSPGMTVQFDVQLDPKGQPQAMNIAVTDTSGVAAYQAANPRPRYTAPRQQSFAPPAMQQQQYRPPQQSMSMVPPPWMPAAAQAVTLHGEAGWFIPVSAIQQQQPQQAWAAAGPAAGMKRGAGMMAGGAVPGPENKFARQPVANPGLDPSEPVYQGAVKSAINARTGYGFIQCDDVFAAYSKDTFIHTKLCPWVTEMELQAGEPVMFNLVIDQKGQPQAKKIIRATG